MRTSTVVDFATSAARMPRRGARLAARDRPGPRSALPVLVVEPDPLIGEILAGALRLHRVPLEPTTAGGVAGALELAREADFRLIVCELELPTPGEGAQLIRRLGELLPGIPVLVLTSGSQAALAALLDLEVAVVTKPPDMDHLLRRVDQLLDLHGDSRVRGIRLEGLLQVLEAERKSCRIVVQARQGEAHLGLVTGRLVHAETARERGTTALFEALRWPDPVLRIRDGEPSERTIEAPLEGLLLRFYVESDHARHAAEGAAD